VNNILEKAIFMLANVLFWPTESNFGHFYRPTKIFNGGFDNLLAEKNGRSNS